MSPEDLARKGYYLFPCNGKTPLVKWKQASTTDIPTLVHWAAEYPGCSWGIDCGKSGLFVIDDDRGKNPEAVKSLLGLELEYGLLPGTFTVRTVSQGFHYYHRGEGRNSAGNKLGPGLDTRGEGGFVVAPCSPGYTVEKDLPVVDVPEWVIDRVGRPAPKPERVEVDIDLDKPGAVAWASSLLCNAEPAIEGNHGNDTTYRLACQVRDHGISQGTCFSLMSDWNTRNEPPWDPQDLARIIENAYSYGQNSPGAKAPENFVTPYIPENRNKPLTPFIEGRKLIMTRKESDFLVHGMIETPSSGIIFGPSTAGKTFVALDLAMSIATGTPWMGKITKQGVVFLFIGEGRQGLRRRMKAWELYHNCQAPEDYLYVSRDRMDFSPAGVRAIAADMKAIQEATGLPVRAFIVDTLARHIPAGADENSAKDVGVFVNSVDWLRDQFNCVSIVVHHTGKKNHDVSRGSSALRGAMDWECRIEGEDGVRSLIWTKQKEIDNPPPSSFRLDQIDINEVDNFGGRVTSAVPVLCDYDPTHGKGNKLSPAVKEAFRLLQLCISAGPNENHVDIETWRQEVYSSSKANSRNSKRSAFNRAKAELEKVGLIECVASTVFDVSLDKNVQVRAEDTQDDQE